MGQHNLSRIDFIIKCVSYRPDMKFQYWNSDTCTKHYYFNELQIYYFSKYNNFLRYSIETEELTEIRLDLDEQSLKDNILLGIELYSKLKSNNIKASFYTTGGKGCHLQFLLNLGNNKIKIEHRKKFKQFFLGKLDILHLVDHAPLSPLTLLGCEGYAHRKTGDLKIYIDIEKYYNLELIMDFIHKNSNKVILNDNFFKDIATIPSLINCNEFKLPAKAVRLARNSLNKKSLLKSANIKPIGKEHQTMLKVFAILYKNYKVCSYYRFSRLFIKYFYDLGLTKESIENLYENLKLLLNKNSWQFEPAYLSVKDLKENFYIYFKYLEANDNIGFNYHNYQTIIRSLNVGGQ